MQLHDLKRKTQNKSEKRVGRGGKRGKTSGRGTKGQKARAGHSIRPDIREQLKKLPKLRGYAFNSIQTKPTVINVSVLEARFTEGETITPSVLIENKIITARRGASVEVKILGNGDLTKRFTVHGCVVSASAKEKIEKVGGVISHE